MSWKLDRYLKIAIKIKGKINISFGSSTLSFAEVHDCVICLPLEVAYFISL